MLVNIARAVVGIDPGEILRVNPLGQPAMPVVSVRGGVAIWRRDLLDTVSDIVAGGPCIPKRVAFGNDAVEPVVTLYQRWPSLSKKEKRLPLASY